jgi:hypothetical protein
MVSKNYDDFPGDGYDWASICTEHKEIYEDCVMCMTGHWFNIEEQNGEPYKINEEEKGRLIEGLINVPEVRHALAQAMVAPIAAALWGDSISRKFTFMNDPTLKSR